MNTEPDYSEQWRQLKRRQRITWLILLGGMPCVLALTLLATLLVRAIEAPPTWIDRAFFVAGGTWMLGSVAAGSKAIAFLCPRCTERFFSTWWYYNGFARKCVHCGLPKWANSK